MWKIIIPAIIFMKTKNMLQVDQRAKHKHFVYKYLKKITGEYVYSLEVEKAQNNTQHVNGIKRLIMITLEF